MHVRVRRTIPDTIKKYKKSFDCVPLTLPMTAALDKTKLVPDVIMETIKLTKRFGLLVMSLLAALAAVSCETVYEGEGDCSVVYKVGFKYTKNILEADAFENQVKSVSLYVFDKQGKLVAEKTENIDRLVSNGNAMDIEVPAPGDYDLIAWGGIAGSNAFTLNNGNKTAAKEDHVVTLNTVNDYWADQMDPLFHAEAANVNFPSQSGVHKVCTMDLAKDTNTVRIILMHYNDREMNKDDFSITVTENNGNGILGPDNSVLPGNPVTYSTWTKKALVVEKPGNNGSRAEVESCVSIVAEIDIARLIRNHNLTLSIVNNGYEVEEYREIIRLPLIDLLMIAKGDARSKMDDQEYLDRQDEYNLVFFINDDNGWYIEGGIFINSWFMALQESEL